MGRTPHGPSLNDYPADLALQLAELERGRAEGTVAPEQLLACIATAREAARRVDLQPWRRRGFRSGLAALACLAGWELAVIAFPDLGEWLGLWLDAVLAAGVIALFGSAWCLVVYVQRRKAERRWFDGLESTVRQGGAIVSYLRETENPQGAAEAASGF